MSKLNLIGDTEIKQFTVTVPGLYAFRRIGMCSTWNLHVLNAGEKIDGQFEGCGPLEFKVEE